MNNYRKAGFILMGVLLVALYIFNRKDLELGKPQFVHIHRISASGGELIMNIGINNPNLLSSTIKTIHGKFSVNGVVIGILDNELNQGIPGLKETEFPTSIRFTNTDLSRALGGDSVSANGAQVTMDGNIEFQNLFTKGNIKIFESAPISADPHEK